MRHCEIPLLGGRTFTERDHEDAPEVAIIDERMAKTAFAGVDPVGRRVRIPLGDLPWLTIVGVVGHIRHDRLDEDVAAAGLLQLQAAGAGSDGARGADARRSVGDGRVARRGHPRGRSGTARLRCAHARSGRRSLARAALAAGDALLGSFATIAVVLASIGVYGVIAYAVGQRSREFGIRLALGARRGEIVALVMRRGALLFAAGAAIGLAAAAASARVFGSLLFQVNGSTSSASRWPPSVLFVVALAACGLPARRAAGVDPSVALRSE